MAISGLQIGYPDFKLQEMIDPEQFDLNNADIQNKINAILAVVNQITDSIQDGQSGADKISLTSIAPFASTKLQVFLEDVVTRLRSTTDGASGADLLASTPISGLTGATVQAQLESLKSLLDVANSTITRHTSEIAGLTARTTSVESRTMSLEGRMGSAESGISSNSSAIQAHRTSADHDNRYYTKSQVDGSLSAKANAQDVYTKQELIPYLQGGDTTIKYEVFTIVSSNNGDKTFTYKNSDNVEIIGDLTDEGYQIFTFEKGTYALSLNRVEAVVNDALHRSVVSGGLVEVSSTKIALSSPEGNGAEITFKYFERVGVTGEHNLIVGNIQPPSGDTNTVWLKVVG